jgi:hypothetical protein
VACRRRRLQLGRAAVGAAERASSVATEGAGGVGVANGRSGCGRRRERRSGHRRWQQKEQAASASRTAGAAAGGVVRGRSGHGFSGVWVVARFLLTRVRGLCKLASKSGW